MSKLYAIIGTSGSGKTTIGRYVFGKQAEVVSMTTREPRRNEVNGRDYYFVDKEHFEELLSQRKLAEYDFYDGNYYGLMIEEIQKKLNKGDAYVVITLHGYKQLKEIFGSRVVSVFIDAKKEHVEAMLKGRNDTNIEKRMESYDKEVLDKFQCDYVIENEFGNMEKSVYQFLMLKNGMIDEFKNYQYGDIEEKSHEKNAEIDG